ncbi:helix-turn-helix domain-containing protein [Pseudomonas sp. LB3P81]
MSEIEAVTTTGAVLGAVLATLRAEANMKQADLADVAGVGPSTWSRIEKGESGLSIDQLRLIAPALGYTPGAILEMAEAAEADVAKKGIKLQPIGTAATSLGASAAGISTLIPVLGNVLGGLIGAQISKLAAKAKNKD